MTTVSLQETPGANRIHIGFYGKRNSGKSSLLNAFAKQQVSIVSDVSGTTTDPVRKPMEIYGLGACVLIDTAGFDDTGSLGESRVEKTKKAAEGTDIALILFSGKDITKELEWYRYFQKCNTPVIAVVNKADLLGVELSGYLEQVEKEISQKPVAVSAREGTGLETLKESIIRALPEDFDARNILGNLVSQGDSVLLVMPQDIQAPKGRLILPQVQTLRELLDKKCLVMSVTADKFTEGLAAMKEAPSLIITDSQVFQKVYEKKPESSRITSFSVLFAAYKGDFSYYKESASVIGRLTEQSHVLIAECCTHVPLQEDIGRKKLPRMLREKIGKGLSVDVVSGTDFPEKVSGYDLIIQCGGCMFNRRYIMSRITRAKEQGVPMTNYGVAIAYLSGILDQISVS